MELKCPSCGENVEVSRGGTCPKCAWQFENEPAAAPRVQIRPAARPKVLPKVDVALTVDRTGSTDPFAEGLQKMSRDVLKLIESKALALKVWLQTHGDRDEGMMEALLTDGGTADQAIADLGTVIFEGGGDPAESHADAVELLMNRVPWNANPLESRGAIIAILTADSKPAQSGHSAAQIGEEIRRRNLLLYVVAQRTPILNELVKAADGLFFEISNTPSKDEVEQIANQLAASIIQTASGSATRPL